MESTFQSLVFSFNAYFKIINASLKFLITQKAEFNICKNQIYISKAFKSVLRFCFKIKFLEFFSITFVFVHLHKALAILSILFQSYLTRNLITQKAYKIFRSHSENTLALTHSEDTQISFEAHRRTLGHSEGTQRSFKGHSGNSWALGHLRHWATLELVVHSGTQALEHLKHSGTWAPGCLGLLGTETIGHSRQLDTRERHLADSDLYRGD